MPTRQCKYCKSVLTIKAIGKDELFSRQLVAKVCPICDDPGRVPAYARKYYDEEVR